MQNAVTLGFDDPHKPVIISADASKSHAGATLEQEVQVEGQTVRVPLGFFSKQLPKSTKSRSTFNRELCSLRMAFQQFRHRVRGRKILVYTDNASLAHALCNTSGVHSPVEMGWIGEIKEYSPEVHHIKGKLNLVADFLSRPDSLESVPTHQVSLVGSQSPSSPPSVLSVGVLAQCQLNIPCKIQIPPDYTLTTKNIQDDNGMNVEIIGIKSRSGLFKPFIPKKLRPLVFQNFHTPSHFGGQKTYEAIAGVYFWETLRTDVLHWANHCPKCQSNKISRHNRQQLHQFPKDKGRLNTIHVDLVGPLPNAHGFPYIFTMKDRGSGFLVASALRNKSSEGIIRAFEQKFISVFGLPETVISDQGSEFTSNLFYQFCTNLGIKHCTTNAGHPQANGLVERAHRILKAGIRSLDNPANWDKHLPYLTMAINNRAVDQNSFTPYQFVFGKPGRCPGVLIPSSNMEDPSNEDVRAFLSIMSFHEQQRRPLPDNKPQLEKGLFECDSVWLRDECRTPLSPLYKGPFEVLQTGEKTFIINYYGKPKSVTIDRVKAHRTCTDQQ